MTAIVSGRRTAKPPISAYRAFPAIAAIWFAALLGLGTLVLPMAVFEYAVAAPGISSSLPAAALPPSATARIAIALIASGVGAALGLFLAHKVRAAHANTGLHRLSKSSDRIGNESPPVTRPISASKELGSERLDDPLAPEIPGHELLQVEAGNALEISPVPYADKVEPMQQTIQTHVSGNKKSMHLAELSITELVDRLSEALGSHVRMAGTRASQIHDEGHRNIPAFAPNVQEDNNDGWEEEPGDSYSSLLTMKSAIGSRSDTMPPDDDMDGAHLLAPSSPARIMPLECNSVETEKNEAALREALDDLERLSKTG